MLPRHSGSGLPAQLHWFAAWPRHWFARGPDWEDVLSCEECVGKHPNDCKCTCKTCRRDKPRRDFWTFIGEHPEFCHVFEEIRQNLYDRLDEASRRARAAEDAKKEAEKKAAQAQAKQKKAAKAAAKAAEAAETASSSSDQPQYAASYYSKIRTELHLGKTVSGVKLTPAMVQERFDKLEARHATLSPQKQATDRSILDDLFEKYKDILADALKSVNEHTSNEVAGLHERLDRLEARLAGDIPERREGQSASDRKRELDEVLPRLRHERQQLVEEEKAEKAAKKRRG
jgi:dGTP triphosphohydrolase